VGLPLAEPR
jgi:hypothetical protein